MSQNNLMREKLARLIKTERFNYFIVSIILFNAVMLGLQTYPFIMAKVGPVLNVLDNIILGIFILELSIYVYVHGFKKCFTDPWFLFDVFIILCSLLASEALSSLRALRVLRVFRLITKFPNLRKIIGALFASLPGIGSITSLLIIFMYVGSLLATNLFGTGYPEDFGTLQSSALTLFQLMVSDDAGNIIRKVNETNPYSWAFFIVFMLVTAFIVLNLFIAAIMDGMQQSQKDDEEPDTIKEDLKEIKKNLRAINRKLE